ncbi:MAG: hypothetical protein JKX94_05670, partial [Sneathiella sp.]|nr:hypothetical protein [Sneathiella sp.]
MPKNISILLKHFRIIAASSLVALALITVPPNATVTVAAESNEEIALNLATLLRSARAVISDNQKLINDASKGDKGLSAEFVVAKAKENFMEATGKNIDDIPSTGLQGELLS